MTKHVVSAVMAASICMQMPPAAAQSILQKTDWQEKKLETFLPAQNPTVPWLNLDRRTKPPKSDIPIGREVNTAAPLVLQPTTPNARVSSNITVDRRGM